MPEHIMENSLSIATWPSKWATWDTLREIAAFLEDGGHQLICLADLADGGVQLVYEPAVHASATRRGGER